MPVLAIDTSNKTLSVAIVKDEGTIVEQTVSDTLQHSVKLMPAIQAVLQESQVSMQELTGVIVAKGPGSYTGLRIGVTVAKTLAKTLHIPLKAVSSLQAIVANVVESVPEGAYVVPFFDARRDNIFTGLYQVSQQFPQLIATERHISWVGWLEKLATYETPLYFVGQLTDSQKEMVVEKLGDKVVFAKENDAIAHAGLFDKLAQDAPEEDADVFVPTYLKLAEAEENWKAGHQEEQETNYVERL
ncbi:tRNA (adenosine(37)-N6)-threonylcarbamoyltransferase complex dimerization subunit type 1 TsaB [uncultured Granulicatella sp.]|uniref:tRNA (adenosine(37)-N6)-threonylcarbamoyltransferase complex dimerization subunit type 1 TsaB n=1 Tax=uncultured Granulicatella sp. TaxID=316089 RepID=UPI0028D8D6F2|nr:tRNA (adenosine(37)-N6)-threonylcarbamoyltransferase complex dimerization subunit type 1 TsaB [uncultured Granulicatella sp.]